MEPKIKLALIREYPSETTDTLGFAPVGWDEPYGIIVANSPVNRSDPLGLYGLGSDYNSFLTDFTLPDLSKVKANCVGDCQKYLDRCYLLAGISGATTSTVVTGLCTWATDGAGVVFCRVIGSGSGATAAGRLQLSCQNAYRQCLASCNSNKCEK
jgi:hypothetical protein